MPRKRGIVPTALAMAADHSFRVVGLHRLEAGIQPDNHPSRRVMEKLRFHEEGLRRGLVHVNVAWRDHLCYALTAEDVPGGLMTRWRSAFQASKSATGWCRTRSTRSRLRSGHTERNIPFLYKQSVTSRSFL